MWESSGRRRYLSSPIIFFLVVEMPKKKPKIGGAVLNADFSYFFYVAQSDPSFDLFIIITLYIIILIY